MTHKAESSPSDDGDSKRQDPSAPLTGRECPACDTPLRGARQRRYCSVSCRNKVSKLAYVWGLSIQEYRRLLDDTGGVCPICQRVPDRWNVEHNHDTMAITGVVCSACNIGLLACSKHDLSMVRRLLDYLENPPADRVLGETRQANAVASREAKIHMIWENHALED